MTNTVLKSLDMINTDFSSIEKKSDTDSIENDFSNILEFQTIQSNQNIKDSKAEDSSDKMTLGDLINTNFDVNNLTILNNILDEETLEISSDFAIVQECKIVPEYTDNTTGDTKIQNNTTTENNENSQETITNEDPTMNKEQILLQPPENLLTFNLLHQNQQILEISKSKICENETNNNLTKIVPDVKNENTLLLKDFKLPDSTNMSSITENAPEEDDFIIKTENQKFNDTIDESVIEELNIESIESEFGESQQQYSDLMQNQTPQEQGVKAILQGDVNFEEIKLTVSSPKTDFTEINSDKLVEQISKQIENLHHSSKVNIVLNPESLGKISIRLMNTKEGLIAQFTVNSQDTKDILIKGLANLKDSLLAQGVNVDNVTVKLTDAGDSEYQGDWTDRENSHGGFKEQNTKHKKENKKQFERMMFEIENNDNV